jgi:hypothetical protein
MPCSISYCFATNYLKTKKSIMKKLINKTALSLLIIAVTYSCTKESIANPKWEADNIKANEASFDKSDTPYLGGKNLDTPYVGGKTGDTPYVLPKVIDTPYRR